MNKRIRQEVKTVLMAQGGKLYGYNVETISNTYGCKHCEVQKAYNYFRFSPQQKGFREMYNVY